MIRWPTSIDHRHRERGRGRGRGLQALMQQPSARSRAHVPALDGVRGIAILVVLVHNLSVFTAHETLLDRLWTVVVESGWVGVQLFFVLSGFLITGILLDDAAADDDTRTPRRVLAFY